VMKQLIVFLAAMVVAAAQITTRTHSAGSKSFPVAVTVKAITCSLGDGGGPSGGTAIIDLVCDSPTRQPSGLQVTINHPPGLTVVDVAPGPATTTAGKTISWKSVDTGSVLVAWSMSATTIPNGVVARVTFSIAGTATGTATATLREVIAANAAGSPIRSTAAAGGGVITISAPAVELAGASCTPTTVTAGDAVTCTVRLTGAAPAGGFVVSVTTSDPTIDTVPPTVTVPAGATTASYAGTTK